jgi:rRNA maturation endonuclease Nob1
MTRRLSGSIRGLNLLRRCHECGQPVGQKEMFCPRCGAKQPREPKNRAP